MSSYYFKDDPDKITKRVGKALLSSSYREYLGRMCDTATREKFGLPEGSTWADAIAFQVIKRSVALVGKEEICFTAIQELRESTEGKTPEKVMVAQNEELLALATAIRQPPAPLPDDSPTVEGESEDQET